MILHPEILRHSPQLATVEMLTQTAETVIIALCAAHPAIEHTPRDDQRSPSERLADRVVDNIMPMLDALDQYRRTDACSTISTAPTQARTTRTIDSSELEPLGTAPQRKCPIGASPRWGEAPPQPAAFDGSGR